MDIFEFCLIALVVFVLILVVIGIPLALIGVAFDAFPDTIFVLVVDGVEYYDVDDVVISSDTISFECSYGSDGKKLSYSLVYGDYQLFERHKGWFKSEYV